VRVIHQITECFECPLERADEEICGHPLMPQNIDDGLHTTRNAPPPDECPLRVGELLIQLRTK
jgi:hypothetical protein